jgi:predicted DNA-binding transcriptional regulator AlpA
MNPQTNTTTHQAPVLVFLDLKEVIRRTGRGKSTIYADESFPKPIKDGGKNKWLEHEIVSWQTRRIEERNAELEVH